MGSDESAAAVRRWFQAFNDGDMEAEAAARTTDFVAHVPGMPMSLNGEEWQQFIGMFFGGFPDMRLEVQDIVAQGDRVAVRWTFHGTHQGEFFGIPPTDTRVTMSAGSSSSPTSWCSTGSRPTTSTVARASSTS